MQMEKQIYNGQSHTLVHSQKQSLDNIERRSVWEQLIAAKLIPSRFNVTQILTNNFSQMTKMKRLSQTDIQNCFG